MMNNANPAATSNFNNLQSRPMVPTTSGFQQWVFKYPSYISYFCSVQTYQSDLEQNGLQKRSHFLALLKLFHFAIHLIACVCFKTHYNRKPLIGWWSIQPLKKVIFIKHYTRIKTDNMHEKMGQKLMPVLCTICVRSLGNTGKCKETFFVILLL